VAAPCGRYSPRGVMRHLIAPESSLRARHAIGVGGGGSLIASVHKAQRTTWAFAVGHASGGADRIVGISRHSARGVRDLNPGD